MRGPRRIERKQEKAIENSHPGLRGRTIVEMLRGDLILACAEYDRLKGLVMDIDMISKDNEDEARALITARDIQRGILRGIATSLGRMEEPLLRRRRDLVKRIERRYLEKSRGMDIDQLAAIRDKH